MIRFLHGADFHLDSAFGALPAQRAAERRRESRELLFRHGIRGYVERIPKTQETGCGYGIYVPQGADAAERILLENHVRVLRRMEHEEDLV